MKLTFSRFLLKEGGKATAEWHTKRAFPKEVKQLVAKVAETLGVDEEDLSKNLLGTSRLTYHGKKSSSGDIDIAVDSKNFPEYHKAMMSLVNEQGIYNTGTKVGSYAVSVGSKKVQVDLMFVDSVDFAKFMYHSSEGDTSKYPGAVRNIMLMTLAKYIIEDGKDFVVKDGDNVIARASKSLKLNTGLERLFKVAKMRKDGQGRTKGLEKVHPDELEQELKTIDSSKIGAFSKDADIINDPDKIAEYFFGENVKAEDIMTAEQVSDLINKKYTGQQLSEIKADIKEQLKNNNFPVPKEL